VVLGFAFGPGSSPAFFLRGQRVTAEDMREEILSLQQQRGKAASEAAKWTDAVKQIDGAIGFARGLLAKMDVPAEAAIEPAG
jgi:hypothetical protein